MELVLDDGGADDSACLGEKIFKLVVGDIPRKVADKETSAHGTPKSLAVQKSNKRSLGAKMRLAKQTRYD